MTFRDGKSRSGSALLIVLGMFSFMLVSAVAFSVYMRSSRAPSSYVRRNASARHLVKAALARAMDEIDTAIGNDPFPGVGYNHDYGASGINDPDNHKNDNWHGHVFTPSNEVAAATTVSTLTLEALGYLPPCLIDEARYWSRHSRTAQWRSFNYGLGQYAFTAVNVSDLFDLNQLIDTDGVTKQRLNRNSSPTGRISPTYLFRGGNTADMDGGGSAAAGFLSAIASGSGFNNNPPINQIPFVSMMDFNLALGGNALGGIASPFMNRLNGNQGRFYSGNASEEVVRRQVFMAGGWNSDTNLTYSEYSTLGRINLRYPEYQPFDGCAWFPAATTLSHCYNDVSASHPFWQPMNDNFPILATALLCDYLDYDNVPLSLCIPCTEAVPMICGVELNANVIECQTEYILGTPMPGPTPPLQIRTDICNLKINKVDFNPTVTVVYPFLHEQPGLPNYEIECYARIFFEEEQASSDSDINDGGLRNAFFDLGTLDAAWSTLNTGSGSASFIEVKCSTPLVIAGSSMFNDFRNATGQNREKKAIISKTLRVQLPPFTKKLADLSLQNPGTGWQVASGTDANQIDFFPSGNLNSANRINLGTTLASPAAGPIYRPMVAMWVRIKDGNGKTVDMSPAIPAYDNMNNFPGNASLNGFNQAATGVTLPNMSARCPAFRFYPQKSTPGITPDGRTGGPYDGITAPPPPPITDGATFKQKAYVANDPRINWAPEQWWVDASGGNPENLWFNNVTAFRSADTTRDQDIFMSVSDQGYLQSMYEWMLIPQVRSLTTSVKPEWGAFENSSTSDYDGSMRTAANNVLHRDLMWRTYRSEAFGYDSGWGSIDGLPFDEAENGLRVNPYTDITNVMLGAFANMPRDWWSAGTNHLANGKNYMNGTTFTPDYLFDWSCTYDDVYRMTAYWMRAFRRGDNPAEREKMFGADGWRNVLDDAWNWREGRVNYSVPDVTVADIEGILQDDMTLADRKFLYGYLKGCFANTAQLFLVFVRAESAAGGGGAGSGARAVALVWRDPNPPMDNSGQYKTATGGSEAPTYGKDNAQKYLHVSSGRSEESWRLNERNYPPHKMRVLFYHQLD